MRATADHHHYHQSNYIFIHLDFFSGQGLLERALVLLSASGAFVNGQFVTGASVPIDLRSVPGAVATGSRTGKVARGDPVAIAPRYCGRRALKVSGFGERLCCVSPIGHDCRHALRRKPTQPVARHSVEWLGEPPEAKLEVFEETETRRIITHNDSPDVGFDYTVNCYRGCIHACTYCFSRPTHEYLGYGAGTDFDRKIVVKVNAAALLRKELMKPSWKGEQIVFSFTSDPYIPLEANYKLTRQCLEVCAEFRQPVGIITKSALIRRDIDVLQTLARDTHRGVFFTIPFTDREVARAVEPYAPSPDARFDAMADLAAAGVPVGIGIAPMIPGLIDGPACPAEAREGSAARPKHLLTCFGCQAVWLRTSNNVCAKLPTKADRVMNRIRDARGGKLNSSVFHDRMRGKGQYWNAQEKLFEVYCRKLGFNEHRVGSDSHANTNTFRRPTAQGSLFH